MKKDYINEVEAERLAHEITKEEFNAILEWIKETSTCKTCKGDRNNVLPNQMCEVCTLPGEFDYD